MSKRNKVEFAKYPIELSGQFSTALRSINRFEVYKLDIGLVDNRKSFGEVVATPAITGISADRLIHDVETTLIPFIENTEIVSAQDFYQELAILLPKNPTARALADIAVESIFESFNPSKIATDVTLPMIEGFEYKEIIDKRLEAGFQVFKLKLGKAVLEENIQRTEKAISLLPQYCSLRIDPNQAWDIDYTKRFLDEVSTRGLKIDYLEQPIDRLNKSGLATLKHESPIPIMADEACFDMEDLNQIIDLGAADWINIKILKSGGITPARKMAKVALDAGLKVSFGCMIESPLGVKAAIKLASEFAPDFTHDLDAAWWYPQEQLIYSDGYVK